MPAPRRGPSHGCGSSRSRSAPNRGSTVPSATRRSSPNVILGANVPHERTTMQLAWSPSCSFRPSPSTRWPSARPGRKHGPNRGTPPYRHRERPQRGVFAALSADRRQHRILDPLCRSQNLRTCIPECQSPGCGSELRNELHCGTLVPNEKHRPHGRCFKVLTFVNFISPVPCVQLSCDRMITVYGPIPTLPL